MTDVRELGDGSFEADPNDLHTFKFDFVAGKAVLEFKSGESLTKYLSLEEMHMAMAKFWGDIA